MNEVTKNRDSFVGYEYRDIVVTRDMEALFADGYVHFGWELNSMMPTLSGIMSAVAAPIHAIVPAAPVSSRVILKFRRDRKIRNKAELTRLQRQFDSCVIEIAKLEKSKTSRASVIAFTMAIVGCAFMTGAVFAFLGGIVPLCIILAVPGFAGWIFPYFCFEHARKTRSAQVTPLIEQKYDEIYDICKRASVLLP